MLTVFEDLAIRNHRHFNFSLIGIFASLWYAAFGVCLAEQAPTLAYVFIVFGVGGANVIAIAVSPGKLYNRSTYFETSVKELDRANENGNQPGNVYLLTDSRVRSESLAILSSFFLSLLGVFGAVALILNFAPSSPELIALILTVSGSIVAIAFSNMTYALGRRGEFKRIRDDIKVD